ncbi:hypothetical protein KKC08_01795 [Patescibacteria group bacterium]|nr:hypothetical protein [Patescibacteria group bacterium]MBU4389917.1 hypothetical protein [Patescibacteria group bacterium]MBU4396876.1 hypothetical protein [Patescibacteria group bacterium]MBU4431373.1 hypothetical protein [Patescibacteria group bacterium]MCG2701881.1 hypothetical protein [Candidatus Parcubacteria bacterium]
MVQKKNRTQRNQQIEMKFHGQFIKEYTTQFIRNFFLKKNFHEIDAPALLPTLPIEPNIYPLKTHWKHANRDFFLSISPEASIKKLISLNIGNCFSISKTFRDSESIGPSHNLEFTLLEWYEINKNYKHIAQTTQKLILKTHQHIQKRLNNSPTNILQYQNISIDLAPPWPTFTLKQLFKKYANIDLAKNLTFSQIKKTAHKKGYNTKNIKKWEPLYDQILLNEIEPNLPKNKPIFIFDYPTRLSPFCVPCKNHPGFSQRFELYIAGIELANAYSELTSAKMLENNFKKELAFRQKHKLPTHPYDKELITSVKNFPKCTGIALGIERLAMLFANTTQISDVLYFPTKKLLSQ